MTLILIATLFSSLAGQSTPPSLSSQQEHRLQDPKLVDGLRSLDFRKNVGVSLIVVGAALPLGLIVFIEFIGGVAGLALGGVNGMGLGLALGALILFSPTVLLPFLLLVAGVGAVLAAIGAVICVSTSAARSQLEASAQAAPRLENAREPWGAPAQTGAVIFEL